ncbi:MAG: hypothetical protein QNK37_00100 [Acidobacteriota bacterium]|nr:hypothetical protein [Acidobacteriota bacterium]
MQHKNFRIQRDRDRIQITILVVAVLGIIIAVFTFIKMSITPLEDRIGDIMKQTAALDRLIKDFERVKDNIEDIRGQLYQLENLKRYLDDIKNDVDELKRTPSRNRKSQSDILTAEIERLKLQLESNKELLKEMRVFMVEWKNTERLPDKSALLDLELRRTVLFMENLGHCYMVSIAAYREENADLIAKKLLEFKLDYGGSDLIGLMKFTKEGEEWYAVTWGHYNTNEEAQEDVSMVNGLFDVNDALVINIKSGSKPCHCDKESLN